MATLAQIERFMKKVELDVDGPLTNGVHCWLWRGAIFKDTGYSCCTIPKKGAGLGHRWIWIAAHGEGAVVAGLVMDHLCRVRHCVNPVHLEQVTRSVNSARGWERRRPTHCRHGHPLSPDNVYVQPSNGRKSCRICRVRHHEDHLEKSRRRRAAAIAYEARNG